MAWCRQASNHYPSQCSHRFMSPYMASPGHDGLTHCGLNKMADIVQTTFPNTFSFCIQITVIQVNSLVPERFEWNTRQVILQLILKRLMTEVAFSWWDHVNANGSHRTLLHVMAWCHQATSHYLSHCRPRSMSPYCITRPQWVKFHWSVFKEPTDNKPTLGIIMSNDLMPNRQEAIEPESMLIKMCDSIMPSLSHY